MSAGDPFCGHSRDGAALRQMAADSEQRSRESWERSDTDGFLSQWANDISARMYRLQAEIADAGGKSTFTGLYYGDRRVKAKKIETRFGWCWLLDGAEAAIFGRKFIPIAPYEGVSRVQKNLGLHEALELAPAKAKIGGSGTGLSGCANAFVEVVRTGDPWGLDSILQESQ
jgi:hypothetical protein